MKRAFDTIAIEISFRKERILMCADIVRREHFTADAVKRDGFTVYLDTERLIISQIIDMRREFERHGPLPLSAG
jgi:hypothetical protein